MSVVTTYTQMNLLAFLTKIIYINEYFLFKYFFVSTRELLTRAQLTMLKIQDDL
jgi:hypothetical protein